MTSSEFIQRYDTLRRMVDRTLAKAGTRGHPRDLREACRYVLTGGGKRVRSILVLLSCEAVGGKVRNALDASAAIEIMHNFTLVHDDIMDDASSRRARPTVHVQWNVNTALLVGDVLLALAYTSLLKTGGSNPQRYLALFTRGVLEVCEGQALDLEFERRTDVTVAEYFRMIERKTGCLLSVSTELGGTIGGGSEEEIRALRTFGHYLGRAFQVQDDLLDVVANEREFGKTIGGDIIAGKRTFLLLRTAERAEGNDRAILKAILERTGAYRAKRTRTQLVEAVSALYHKYGVIGEAQREVSRNTRRAIAALSPLRQSNARDMLHWLAKKLLHRAS